MEDEYIKRPEFENFKDHVDDQHVELIKNTTQTEITIMNKLDSNLKWAIGTLLGLITFGILILSGIRDSDQKEVNGDLGRHDELIQQNIEQTLINTHIIGAGLDRSNAKDSEILDKMELIQEKNEMQLQHIEDRVREKHQ